MTTHSASKMAPRKPLRYHLRYQLIPGKDLEQNTHDLVDFCTEHGVEEVVLFFAAEEWNNGLLSGQDEDIWYDTIRTAKEILGASGVVVSLNPWMTVLHVDRGRTLPEDRNMKPMVSPLGEVSKACASFADPGWQRYIFGLYGRFAQLGFRVIWVEDDFRYHNHGPLTWGGGFEPEVLAIFSQKVGRSVRREEVVANILRTGEPHPWRELWMDTWREIQLDVARGIAHAVTEHSPGETRLGLMSSLPSVHSVEGRRWKELFDALTLDNHVVHRPHYAGYSDSVGKQATYSIMMLDIQRSLRPSGCEVAPEVENWPFTHWNKSDTQTWTEMALDMFYGSDALLLDLFPFSGNSPSTEPRIGTMLDRSRPALEWISERFPKTFETRGVGIPWKEDAQAHVRTTEGKAMGELNAASFGPGTLLLSYGAPVSASAQKVNALFGTLAWAFDDGEIRRMLSGGLLLDGESADILCQRGFGSDMGVDFDGWLGREGSTYSVEEIVSEHAGVQKGLYFSANSPSRMGLLNPIHGAEAWTSILTPEGARVGAGIVAHENRMGGRVVTYAMPTPAELPPSTLRQKVVHSVVAFLSREEFDSPMISGGAHLMPMHFQGDGKNFVVVLNGSPDAAFPVARIPCVEVSLRSATLLAPLQEPAEIAVDVQQEKGQLIVTCENPVPYMGFLVLEW
ncbi:MAG: hypothetical protein V1800_09825 [Candidatus Latescibacterota bacterium]